MSRMGATLFFQLNHGATTAATSSYTARIFHVCVRESDQTIFLIRIVGYMSKMDMVSLCAPLVITHYGRYCLLCQTDVMKISIQRFLLLQ